MDRVKEDKEYLVPIEYDCIRFKTPLFILITLKFESNVIFQINQGGMQTSPPRARLNKEENPSNNTT